MISQKFVLKDKEIVFLGSSHGKEKEKIDFFRNNLVEFEPDLILIEGGFENATFNTELEAIEKGWELGFVSFFAKLNKIELRANDPQNFDSINFLEKKYSKDTAFVYFILRNLSMSLKQDTALSNKEKIKNILMNFKRDSKWNNFDFSWKNFLALFEEIFNSSYDVKKEYLNLFNPAIEISSFNPIAKELSFFRDNFLRDKLKTYLKQYNRILIVKGEGHFENYKKVIGEVLDVR